MRSNKKLAVRKLDEKIAPFKAAANVSIPPSGWLSAIRSALNMTLEQFGNKLGMSKDGAYKLEKREATGAITLNSLRDAANALDMQVVYAVIPKESSLEEYTRKHARKLAVKIVSKTNQQMKLEAQEIGEEALRQAIEDTTDELVHSMDRTIWHLK